MAAKSTLRQRIKLYDEQNRTHWEAVYDRELRAAFEAGRQAAMDETFEHARTSQEG